MMKATTTLENLDGVKPKVKYQFSIEVVSQENGTAIRGSAINELDAATAFSTITKWCQEWDANATVNLYFHPRRLSEVALVKSINVGL